MIDEKEGSNTMMTRVKSGIGHLSDRMLARIVPHKTADAIQCQFEVCCVIGADWKAWVGNRQVDPLHGTGCTACTSNFITRC
ncbi:hypothetical protein [Nonomuraea sp. NPDC049695]|uniref:hypothetical protein n=1 Tax=Nonomuraea sp. NPDC049695 TaxID=3154734 RepID=UPI003423DD49